MTRVQFDFSSFDPRRVALIVAGLVVIIGAVILFLIFRNSNQGEETASDLTPSAAVTASPTLLPSPSGPPTETPTPGPTATLEPYEYVVQAGDTLLFIIQLFGYRDTGVVPEVIALNSMANENDLIAGQTLFIPRQTPTVGPTFTPTPTRDPLITPPTATNTGTPGPTIDPNITVAFQGCSPENRCASPDGLFWLHEVREGDTIAQIAFEYGTSTIECILRENGLPPNPPIFPGQQIKVCILLTLTPTLTPTGGPNSTATPTPTPSAPSLLSPAQNAEIPRSRRLILQWAAVRPLLANESYLIIIRNVETGEETRAVTRSNAYRLPTSLQPGPARSIQYEWRVVVIRGNSPDSPIISGPGEARVFTWG